MVRIKLRDVLEEEAVCERTAIDGLYWIKNSYLITSEKSRIILPQADHSTFTIVYHGEDFSSSPHGGYEVYGIHLGQDDVLTFLSMDGREMRGHFVDCRAGSPTLHTDVELTFEGDPHRALVIERGIAHIFDNLANMVTLNQPRIYFDTKNPDFDPYIDVMNVPRSTPPDEFPVVQVNRYRAPRWLVNLGMKYQRIQLRKGMGAAHPFRFKVGAYRITLTPREYKGLMSAYSRSNECED